MTTYLWTGPAGYAGSSAQSSGTLTIAGTYTLTITNADGCSATCTRELTVNDLPVCEITGNDVICSTETTTFTATGGTSYAWTGPGGFTANTASTGPINVAGTYTVTVTDANGCSSTCSRELTVNPCGEPLCTYTQGAYGNKGGKDCDGENKIPTAELIYNSITDGWGNSLVIGKPGNSVTATNADVNNIIKFLPGGGGSRAFTHLSDISISDIGSYGYLSKNRINNTLFAQTLTLGLNMGISGGIDGDLANFDLEWGKWLVTADILECGKSDIKECQYQWNTLTMTWDVTYSPYQAFDKISQALWDALPTKDVAGLYELANRALAGQNVGVSLSEIAGAVDMINNAFDECRMFITWSDSETRPSGASFCTNAPVTLAGRTANSQANSQVVTGGLKVSAYPNPFTHVVRFTIESKVSGQAQLEILNMVGQRVATVYNGYIQANKGQVVEYRVPANSQSNLIYMLRIGNQQATGKLLRSIE
jgi:hypothetical protein